MGTTLYLGDKKVSPVTQVEVPKEKYGADIDDFLGDIDENGTLHAPKAIGDLVFDGVKSVGDYGLESAFCYNGAVTSVSFPDLISINGREACYNVFYSCLHLISTDFPKLTTINGINACNKMFSYGSVKTALFPSLTTISGGNACGWMFIFCSDLTDISFPKLTTINGDYACYYMFSNCPDLTNVEFPSLTTISGGNACYYMFSSCSALTNVSFPALTEIGPEGKNDQFSDMFRSCYSLEEIHFPAAMQTRIEQLLGFDKKFGATNATISFDK